MTRQETEHASRAELIFVAVLFVIAAGAIAGAVLREREIGFAPPIAAIIYRALWTVLWLPGMAMAVVLLVGTRRARLAVGLALQCAAVALYWTSSSRLPIAGTLGVLGLGLPVFIPVRGETFGRSFLRILLLVTTSTIAHAEDAWPFAVAIVVALWVPYAAAIWPGVDKALEEVARREEERRKSSRAYRYLDRALVAFAVLLIIAMLVIAIIAHVWAGRLSSGWFAR
jgi:hypothetical protein